MKASPFEYVRVYTVEAALSAYANAPVDASYLSGGQSLLPALSMRLSAPSRVIDIGRIETMRGLRLVDGVLRIGALTRHHEVGSDGLIAKHAPLLAAAVPYIAHPAIRNMGTLGGSLALADPSSEFPALMLTLDATLEITGAAGARLVAANDFFLGLYETAIEPGEILTAILIPSLKPNERWAFDELSRRRGDYALVGVGIQASFTGAQVNSIRIAMFSVASKPIRALAAESALAGMAIDSASIKAAQAALSDDLDPADDVQMPGTIRLHLARVLLGRLLRRLGGLQ